MSGPIKPDRSEAVFEDFKQPLDATGAVAEANRCLFCYDAPCIQACPTGIDIPEFIRKIGTGNTRGSAKTILDSNILGMSCARVCPVEVLCEGDCVYNDLDAPPIKIGKLQRFATDQAYDAGWTYYEAGPDTGRSVGLIGGGPASLAAAHRLRMHGHAVTLYDKRPQLGGLNTTGVAPYKMRADRAMEEVDWVLSIGGIDVQTGVSVPDDVSWEDMEARHDAVLLGMGLGADSHLDVPGSDLEGIEGAVAFIERMKLGQVDLADAGRVLVLGGGNTAVDMVRELLGLGVAHVEMVYRGTEARMSGYAHEWKIGKQDGAKVTWGAQPIGYEGRDGRVTGVRCVQLDGDRQPIEGSEHVIAGDRVLLAVGQAKLGELVAGLEGVELSWGRVVTDEVGATGRPGVYAAGDCRNGGKEVVNAVAEGRDAAEAIHAYLSRGDA